MMTSQSVMRAWNSGLISSYDAVSSIHTEARTSVIRLMKKVNSRWRPLTSNSSEVRKQFLYHFSQLILVFSNGPYRYSSFQFIKS